MLHPDRHLPIDSHTRDVAREIYAASAPMPIVSPHGHVDPGLFVRNEPFADPTALLITPDHYVTRLLHARGADLRALGVGTQLDEAGSRAAWQLLCEAWPALAGTAVRTWLEAELAGVFGVTEVPDAQHADALYDAVADRLASEQCRPRQLYGRFDLAVLATTDDPCDTLADHAALAADPTWSGRVIPTFRPDRYLEPGEPEWPTHIANLAASSQIDCGSYEGYIAALEDRRQFFIAHGATSADHSHDDVGTAPLSQTDAARIYRAALGGTASAPEAVAFRRHMLGEMARMSCDDGLVMTLHPGVFRNHHRSTFRLLGPDTGHDLPRQVTFVEPLRPLLERFGTYPGFHLVCFTLDETTWARELAPLAGFYRAVRVGVPWWFLDAPAALVRFWDAIVDGVGFSRTSGFVDDTRALCSIPARHDLARRVEAGVLARLVVQHRIPLEEATALAVRLAGAQPIEVFKL